LREVIDKVKNLENNGNYKIAIEARQSKSKAYKANIRRRIRCLIYYGRYKSNKLGSNGIDNKSDIKSRSKAAARL
jgi:hypothetical protein